MTKELKQSVTNYLSRYCTYKGGDLQEYEDVKLYIDKRANCPADRDELINYATSSNCAKG
jgi:hypothetical protein